MMAGVKLTIVYDWRNDGPDPADKEANFGLLDFYGTPKPALMPCRRWFGALAGLHYMGPIRGGRHGDIVLAFGQDGVVHKMVGWSVAGGMIPIALSDLACGPDPLVRSETNPACESKGAESSLAARRQLTGTPSVFMPDQITRSNEAEAPPRSR